MLIENLVKEFIEKPFENLWKHLKTHMGAATLVVTVECVIYMLTIALIPNNVETGPLKVIITFVILPVIALAQEASAASVKQHRAVTDSDVAQLQLFKQQANILTITGLVILVVCSFGLIPIQVGSVSMMMLMPYDIAFTLVAFALIAMGRSALTLYRKQMRFYKKR